MVSPLCLCVAAGKIVSRQSWTRLRDSLVADKDVQKPKNKYYTCFLAHLLCLYLQEALRSGAVLFCFAYLTLPLFLVGHDVGYYGPPFFPVGSNFCASVYVHSCISGDVSQPSASLPSSTAFAIYHAFCDYTL